MSSFDFFDYTVDKSFKGKCSNPSWNRTVGVERQLCNLLNEARDAPITYSQVRSLTGWDYLVIRRWFAVLLTAGVFTDEDTHRTQRWRLSRDFPHDRASLVKLIPPVGSTIVSRKQVDNQSTSKTDPSIPSVTVTNNVDKAYVMTFIEDDDSDDFCSVFSRI